VINQKRWTTLILKSKIDWKLIKGWEISRIKVVKLIKWLRTSWQQFNKSFTPIKFAKLQNVCYKLIKISLSLWKVLIKSIQRHNLPINLTASYHFSRHTFKYLMISLMKSRRIWVVQLKVRFLRIKIKTAKIRLVDRLKCK